MSLSVTCSHIVSVSSCLDLALLGDLLPPTLPVVNHLLRVGFCWVSPTSSLGPSSSVVMAEPRPRRSEPQTSAGLLYDQALTYRD